MKHFLKNPEFLIQNLRSWHVLIFFVCAACVLYAAVFGYPFVHDDAMFIVMNPDIGRWNWRDIFLTAEDFGTSGQDVVRYYRPVLEIVNRAVYAVFGANPAAFHGFNIVLHAVNAWLVFLVARSLSSVIPDHGRFGFLTSLMVGIFFLVHPIQTQAVCAVAGVSNLALAFFVLASSYFYLELVRTPDGKRTPGLWAGLLISFGLALLSKEQALVFVPLVIVLEVLRSFFAKNPSGRMLSFRIISALVFVTALYVLWKHFAVGAHTAFFDDQSGGWLRILSIPHILWVNLSLLAVPRDLHYFRSLDLFTSHLWPTLWLIAVLGGIVWMAVISKLEERFLILAGLAWFVIAQATTLQIVPIFWEYSFMSLAEHFLYLPSAGFFILAAGLIRTAYAYASKSARILTGVLLWAAVMIFCFLTAHQSSFWKSEVRLFERAAFYQPQLGRVQHLLSKSYLNEGHLKWAFQASQRSLAIMSDYERKSEGESAKRFYRMHMTEAMATSAMIAYQAGDMAGAVEWMEKASNMNPDDPALHNHLGIFCVQNGQPDAAERHFRKALDLGPDNIVFVRNYAFFLKGQNRFNESRSYWEKVLLLDPSDPAALNELRNIFQE